MDHQSRSWTSAIEVTDSLYKLVFQIIRYMDLYLSLQIMYKELL